MDPTEIDDSELLYRRVPAADEALFSTSSGRVRFSSSAFNDRGNKPSVDRSSLRESVGDVRTSPTDGVAMVVTIDVRRISNLAVAPSEKNDTRKYAVDAIHRPIVEVPEEPDNVAHSQIECNPEITNNHFKKLKEALARLAEQHGWVVAPAG